MARIREWLLNRAHNEFFSFDNTDFEQECDDIVEGYVEADDPVAEDANRSHCWDLLQSWQRDKEYLSSLNLHKIVARHVRECCRKAQKSACVENWVELEFDSSRLDGSRLTYEIESEIRATWKARAPFREDRVTNLKLSDELKFEGLDTFHFGLEKIIGYPPTNSNFLELMKREHEQGETFVDQKGRVVNPKVEWNIVMRSEKWNISGAECDTTSEIEKREIGRPLDFYFQKAQSKFADAKAEASDILIEAEVAALRLWTGPMHRKYAEVLRDPKTHSGLYVTTLHAINSGITKLARIWRLPASRKVYRGYHNRHLKELKKDAFQCIGGVEKCVLATSEDFDIAVQYSGDRALILEMDVGQVNRGADVSWLSQFPHEKEILFNALSNVEFVGSPQLRFIVGRGTILVYQVCVSANVKSKTLEEFVRLRKDLHLNLVEVLIQEVLRMIDLREKGSRYALIKILGAKCRNQCDSTLQAAKDAEVGIFNGGTLAYVKLVEDAIMLQSTVLEIIDLALRWFETGEADPDEVDRLQAWQLKALRTAIRSDFSDFPKVRTIVLDEVRVVESLFAVHSLDLGAVHKAETVYKVAKLLTLNPNLNYLTMEVPNATAEVWEIVFKELCPGRPSLFINGFLPSEYAADNMHQKLVVGPLDIEKAAMIAPAFLFHPPSQGALTSLSLNGTPIGCTGAKSLGRAFSGLQKLQYLDLRSCNIFDLGCTGISHSLATLTDLENLNLAHNHVNDDGFNILASVIRTDGLLKLKSVDIRFNKTSFPSLHCGLHCILRNNIISKLSTNASAWCVAWSPGGDKIVTGGGRPAWKGGCYCELIIWDAKTGDVVSKLKGHSATVTSIAWRPGGDQIASGSWDNTIIIWDAKTGEQVSTLKGHTNAVLSVAWRPGGDQIVSGGYCSGTYTNSWELCKNPGEIIIWDAKTGDQLSTLKGHTSEVTCVAWRPGGDQIASASYDKTIIIWDAKTGEQISTLKGHTNLVTSVAWRPGSPGGDQIVSGGYGTGTWESGWDADDYPGELIIWDAKTGTKVSTLKGHTKGVNSVAWHPGGDQIVSGGYGSGNVKLVERETNPGEFIIWDAKTGNLLSKLKGHTAAVTSVAWRPGGDQIASASTDETITIWDVQNEKTWDHVNMNKVDQIITRLQIAQALKRGPNLPSKTGILPLPLLLPLPIKQQETMCSPRQVESGVPQLTPSLRHSLVIAQALNYLEDIDMEDDLVKLTQPTTTKSAVGQAIKRRRGSGST